MTLACAGIGITRSIAIGNAHLLSRGRLDAAPAFIPREQIPDEVDRFRQALSGARRALRSVRKKIPQGTRSDIAAFIDTHLLMLEDAALAEAPIEHIREQHCSAEWALQIQRNALIEAFDLMEDPYLRTRKDDVDHVVNQILKILLKKEDDDLSALAGHIVLAHDLTPSDVILMHHQGIAGFVTETGGPMSHTAILARSLNIPAVVGVHHATRILQHGEQLVIDARPGMVLAGIDSGILSHYQSRIQASRERNTALRALIDQPAVTIDGQRVELQANIELPEEIPITRKLAADGVGLYRTEYLYMNRPEPPDEAAHYDDYRQVVEGLNGIPVTIRTLDLGADKPLPGSGDGPAGSSNPALGLRAIRLCLKEPRLFLPQLRAILRVARLGPVRIMVPMLSGLQEVRQLREMLHDARQSLRRDGVPFNPEVEVGGMIEVPAAALCADAFARNLDFLSIGTNDLIQYSLAIDRLDDEVTYLYDPLHPAVLRLIQMVIDAGRRHRIPVSMCGEMAGDPSYIPLLLGMGLRQFSMQPGALLEAKRLLRSLDAGALAQQVAALMTRLDQPDSAALLQQICNGRETTPR